MRTNPGVKVVACKLLIYECRIGINRGFSLKTKRKEMYNA